MKISKEHQGELIIFFEAFLWSFFPVITILTYSALNPMSSLAWSILFATFFFAVMVSLKNKWHEYSGRGVMRDLVMITILNGIFFYGLMFWGLSHTKAGNAAIIMLMEIFFSFLFFNVWKKEHLGVSAIMGILMMFFAALIVLLPKHEGFYLGDIIILFATMIPPLGNYFQQKVRKKICAESLMFMRGVLSLPFLFLLSYVFFELEPLPIVYESLGFLLINGVLLFGVSKVLWIEAIHRISVTKAISLASVAPFFTLISAYFFLKEVPTFWQLAGLVPMVFGVLLLTRKKVK